MGVDTCTMYKTAAILVVLLALGAQAIPAKTASPSCIPSAIGSYPHVYVPNAGKSYSDAWFMIDLSVERTWPDSKNFCDSLGQGYHIASIFNSDETAATMTLFNDDAWIGGVSDKVNWAWAYGLDNNYAPVSSYINWEEGQPGYGDYGMYYIRSDLRTGEWDDKGSPDREELVVCMLRCDNA